MDRVYPSSKFIVYINVAAAPLMALFVIGFMVYAAFGNTGPSGPRVLPVTIALAAAALLGILAPLGYVSLRSASQIRVKDDSVAEFRGPLLKMSLSPSAIISVRASPWTRNSWVALKHSKGKLLLYTPRGWVL